MVVFAGAMVRLASIVIALPSESDPMLAEAAACCQGLAILLDARLRGRPQAGRIVGDTSPSCDMAHPLSAFATYDILPPFRTTWVPPYLLGGASHGTACAAASTRAPTR